MSLDNIQLPAIVLQDLYKQVLIDTGMPKAKQPVEEPGNINFLGNNNKHITIITSNENTIYLPDEELSFLMGILAACTLSMADVALVNLDKSGPLTYTEIEKELSAEIILLFGIIPSQLQLPLQFPHYQIQKYNNQVYHCCPALSIIAADKAEKTKLWNCLKQIFSI